MTAMTRRGSLWLAAAFMALALTPTVPVAAANEPDGHISIIWHINARQPWIGPGTNAAKLEAALLKQCNKVLKADCKVAMTFSTGASIIGQMANGNHFVSYSKTSLADARAAMDEQCRTRDTDCIILHEFEALKAPTKTSYQVPKASPDLFRRFGAVAWQKPTTRPVRVWVATGRNTQDLAKGDALANCQADTGGECVVAQYGADTTLIVYTADGKSLAVTQDSDLDRAQNMVRFICLREKQACKVQAVVDSELEETSVYNIAL